MLFYKIHCVNSFYDDEKLRSYIGDCIVDEEFKSPQECALYTNNNKHKLRGHDLFTFIPYFKIDEEIKDRNMQLSQSGKGNSQLEIQFV